MDIELADSRSICEIFDVCAKGQKLKNARIELSVYRMLKSTICPTRDEH